MVALLEQSKADWIFPFDYLNYIKEEALRAAKNRSVVYWSNETDDGRTEKTWKMLGPLGMEDTILNNIHEAMLDLLKLLSKF